MEDDFDYELPEGDSVMDAFGDDDFDAYDGDDFDDYDGFDDFDDEDDDFDDFDDFDDEDGMLYADDFDEDDFDDFDEDDFDDFEDESFEEDAFDEAVAYALTAEDPDEFFKKLWRGIKKVGRGFKKVVRKVAPVVAKVASFIPHPAAQAIGAAARIASRLRFEAEDEIEAMEMAGEAAKKVPAAALVTTALAAKRVTGRKGKMMSKTKRKKVAKLIRQAVKVASKKSPSGPQAVAQIAKRVARQTKGASPVAKAAIVKKVAKKAARKPGVINALARKAKPRAKAKARRILPKASVGRIGRAA